MAEEVSRKGQVAPASDTLEVVTVASQAQAAKVKEVLNRADLIASMDPNRVKNIADLLTASKADGGCGIGCW